MKKIHITVAILFLLSSCSKIETPQPMEQKAVLVGTIEEDTKTSLDGLKVKWSTDDALAVLSDSDFTITEYSLMSGAGKRTGTFEGEKKNVSTYYLAVYPYANTTVGYATSYGGPYAVVSVPLSQQYVADGFDNNLLPMSARGYFTLDPKDTHGSLIFQYLGGVVQIKLFAPSDTRVTRVDLTVTGNYQDRNGNITDRKINIDLNKPVSLGGRNARQTYSLTCPNVLLGKNAEDATVFNIVYTGGFTASKGFTITVRTDKGNMTLKKTSSFEFTDGKIIRFPATAFVADAIDETRQVSLDKVVWHTLATFEETPTTALYVRTIGSNPLNSKDIDRIKQILARASSPVLLDMSRSEYISDIHPLFSDNTQVSAIKIPQNIKYLPANVFSGCSSLSNIELSGIETIGTNAFTGCTLSSITIPATIQRIEASSFCGTINTIRCLGPMAFVMDSYDSLPDNGTLIVPNDSAGSFKNSWGWLKTKHWTVIEGMGNSNTTGTIGSLEETDIPSAGFWN